MDKGSSNAEEEALYNEHTSKNEITRKYKFHEENTVHHIKPKEAPTFE